MAWLIFTIIAYAIFAIVALGDKYFLSGPIPDPKFYAFTVGITGLIVLFAVPFLGFPIPPIDALTVALLTGSLFVISIFILFYGLHYFEASRIIPAVGGLTPIFALLVGYVIFPDMAIGRWEYWAFGLLCGGTLLITGQNWKKVFSESLAIALIAAIFFGASLSFSKFAYEAQSFWSGFLWIRIGAGIAALGILLLSSQVRGEVRSIFRHKKLTRRTRSLAGLFFVNQGLGAVALVLQNLATSLAPISSVPFVSALQGVQYAFLLALTALLRLRHPKMLRERSSAGILIQKLVAVAMISAGLVLLALSPAASGA